MKVKIPSIYYIILYYFLILDLKFFDLIDTTKFNIMGIYYSDIVFLSAIGCVCFALLDNRLKFWLNKLILIIALFVGSAFLSSYSANFSYNQSILAGLAAQREWLSWIILIFPISLWLKSKKIEPKGIITCIRYVCRVYAFICIVQYFVYDYVKFTYTMSNMRYGDIRLYFNTSFFSLTIFAIIDELFDKKISKERKYKGIAEIGIYLFIIFVITKGRMVTLALVFSMAVFFCTRRNIAIWKRLTAIGFVCIGCLLFLNTTIGQDIMGTLTGSSGANDTLGVRGAARAYYLSKVMDSPRSIAIGYGVPNIHNILAMSITNPLWQEYGEARFYLTDVGLTGILFQYGLLGVGILFAISIYQIILSRRIYISSNQAIYLNYIIFDAITWISLTPTIFDTSCLGTLILCSIIYDQRELCLKEKLIHNSK